MTAPPPTITANTGVKKAFATACDKAKVPYGRKVSDGITFHDLRRTVKTNMADAGIEKAHRDTILGHTLEGMDRHYISLSEESLTSAMDKFTSWVDEQLEETRRKSEIVDQSVDQTQNKDLPDVAKSL